jgi:hypothetical protein
MAEAVSTGSNDASTKYHTVNVCANLPKVDKNYPCEQAEDLPHASYWMHQRHLHRQQGYKKVQRVMANGPRES